MLKRIADIGLSVPGLILLAPLYTVLCLLIAFVDGFPVLFRQVRVGRNGCDFMLYKFRTMTVSAKCDAGSFDAGDCSRVTRLGHLLRKSKLDELPQLWNVLWGDMSFVGPRPEVRKWVEVYPERWANILVLRPGITDPASLIYCNEEYLLGQSPDPVACYREEILPRKLDLYEEYLRTRTLMGDFCLILRTLASVFFMRATGTDTARKSR